MPFSEQLESRLKTTVTILIFLIFAVFVPLRIAGSQDHSVLPWMNRFQFLGPVLIAIGMVGYIMSIWRFFTEAKASPLLGDSQALIVKGIYHYSRNPIYVSVWIVLLGYTVFYASLDLFYYLLLWVLIFNIVVRFAEEPYLKTTFGEEYDKYCKTVPRWIPGPGAWKKGQIKNN
jgi:protein-S-isoprenylcysteine O-methyltransferase Ste14